MTIYDYQQHLWDCINHLDNWIGFARDTMNVESVRQELLEFEQEEEQVQLLLDLTL